MHLDAAHPLLPIVTLAAGVFLMIAPRIVSFAVAVYLIIVGPSRTERDLSHLQIVPGTRDRKPRAVLERMSMIVNQFTFARHGAC
jgi:hypothetical protein